MADLNDLEYRLKQCRMVMSNILENLDYIERELNIAKGQKPQERVIQDNIPNQQANIPDHASYKMNNPAYKGIYSQNMEANNPNSNMQNAPAPGNKLNSNSEASYSRIKRGNYSNSIANNHTAEHETNKSNKSSISLESIFGKNIMAIAASILIFISLILFATLILPKLTQEVKFIMLCIGSIGITAFGLIKWFKKQDSVLFTAITACGTGAVYITLFLGNVYFKMIGYILLFILLACWTAGVLYLSKYKKIVFEIIGSCGIVIATIFGTITSIENTFSLFGSSTFESEDLFKLFVTVIFFIIGILAFMLFGKYNTSTYLITNSASILSSIFLSIGLGFFASESNSSTDGFYGWIILLVIVLALFFAGMIIFNLLKTNKGNDAWFGLFGICYSIFLGLTLTHIFYDSYIFKKNTGLVVTSVIVCISTVVLIEFFSKKKWDGRRGISTYFWLGYLFTIIIFRLFTADSINTLISLSILAASLIVYGFLSNDAIYKYFGLAVNIVMILSFGINPIIRLFAVIAVFALINAFMYFKNSEYSSVIKCISYCVFFIGLYESLSSMNDWAYLGDEFISVIMLLVLGFINILAFKSPYRKNWEINEDDKAMLATGHTINVIMMIASLGVMFEAKSPLEHWIAVLAALALFMINSINLMKLWNGWGAVYVGVKSTLLLISILVSFDKTDNILSIAVFILSILIIGVGFIYKEKALRIYGLALSLICVIKLVMIDITYKNSVGHALSFFISGVLCFVISAIYSYFEKKTQNKI